MVAEPATDTGPDRSFRGAVEPGTEAEPDIMSAVPGDTVGASVPRVDARVKCSGRAEYLADLVIPGMVYAKVVRSPPAHGRLVSVRCADALGEPGVLRVVTAANMPRPGARYGHLLRDQQRQLS